MTNLSIKERTLIDIKKLRKALKRANEIFKERHKNAIVWAENYLKDAEHFYEKGDYFTSFGCANYAYGILDGLFIIEGIKERIYEEEGIWDQRKDLARTS